MATSENKHATQAAKHLAELEPGRQDYRLFKETARLFVQSTVELVPIRKGEFNRPEVLLIQRPEDDEFWPNQWHIPGSVALSSDTVKHPSDYDAPLQRILHDELQGDLKVMRGPFELGTQRRISPRGHEISIVHWAEVNGDPANGTFFDIADIQRRPPEGGIVDTHELSIQRVADLYTP